MKIARYCHYRLFVSLCAITVNCGAEPNRSKEMSNESQCGNGIVEGDEVCDDGNTLTGDYCNSSCEKIIGSCGDGRWQSTVELCDSGGACGTQYCSADCQTYIGVCGDGVKQIPEKCDDGNTNSEDGCSDECGYESSDWTCTGSACGRTICSM